MRDNGDSAARKGLRLVAAAVVLDLLDKLGKRNGDMDMLVCDFIRLEGPDETSNTNPSWNPRTLEPRPCRGKESDGDEERRN